MKSLVVVESPSKAKTINKYLGKDYVVKASKGHVVDLPKSKMGVDVDHDFKVDYVVKNEKSLSELKKAYKGADKLILAVDLDREGEAIAWHVAQKLGALTETGNPKRGHDVERIVFSEITEDAIKDAIEHPRKVDMNLVNAQQARRILDRLVGYTLSPVLWKKIMFGLSAGRVQSVALRLVVEKEEERNKFDPEEYWSLISYANDKKGGKPEIEVKIKEDGKDEEEKKEKIDPKLIPFEYIYEPKTKGLKNQKSVEKIIDEVKKEDLVVEDVIKKESKRNPKAPYTTSTLQQAAVNTLGFTSKRTMMVAQKLYEAGFITYMRTDSTAMSKQAIDAARKLIKDKYGDKYLPEKPNIYSKQSKSAQEAHEAIRPVKMDLEDDKSFKEEQKKLYRMIRNRALASQMNPARVETVTITAKAGSKHKFKATGTRVLFDGYLKLKAEKQNEVILPEVQKDDKFYHKEIKAAQHFTQPPAKYSEATLIKKLEELGIGRPSTYSSIISTIVSRKYVEKEGRYLFPTDMGIVVNKLLVSHFKDIVDYDFTSEMEDNLDVIAEGGLDWKKMLKDFYKPFAKNVKETEKTITRDDYKILGKAPKNIKCPECNSKMVIKLGRYGRFYSCTKWPDCEGILSMDGESQEDLEKKPTTKEFQETYMPAPKTEDDRDYVLKRGRFGEFWAHPDYPKVKDARPLEYTKKKRTELFGPAPKTDKGDEYLLRSGKYGYFWAHPDYPKVKDIQKVKKQPKKEEEKED
ncbi:type I DNA topoisomerase [Candidatus Dojkabacteria bacterium]|uniref:DNA topoisomerase 1 n=1 Tax=Candidatus Dojkabacteria bacterium TaxID=2099670 RepID=A0A955IAH3_9BACT|nr:type I DNA topoisomerase [Candidatus Dojkabacteria bacterium]